MSTTETPSERSARIVREMREDAAMIDALADKCIKRLAVLGGGGDFTDTEVRCFKIGFRDGYRELRAQMRELDDA